MHTLCEVSRAEERVCVRHSGNRASMFSLLTREPACNQHTIRTSSCLPCRVCLCVLDAGIYAECWIIYCEISTHTLHNLIIFVWYNLLWLWNTWKDQRHVKLWFETLFSYAFVVFTHNALFFMFYFAGWREVDGLPPRQQGLKEALEQLLGQIKGAHRHCACHGKYSLRTWMKNLLIHTEPQWPRLQTFKRFKTNAKLIFQRGWVGWARVLMSPGCDSGGLVCCF